jgi:hypothetical protein
MSLHIAKEEILQMSTKAAVGAEFELLLVVARIDS